MSALLQAAAVALVTAATIGLGTYGLRLSRTTSDFYVASRAVSPAGNAAAISGEYLSAASFLGVAGLIMTYGADMLWYPVGYAAGYFVMLLLVAAPLRRCGAYTLPDFAEERFASPVVRQLTSVLVVVIGWFYLVPQLHGAGLTVGTITGAPQWVGALTVAAVVVVNVLAGGMRSITLVQGFQFWLKLTAISVPAVFLLLVWRADGAPAMTEPRLPAFRETTTVRVESTVRFEVSSAVDVVARGAVDRAPRSGAMTLTAGTHVVGEGTRLTFPAGAPVPHVANIEAADNRTWSLPLGGTGDREHTLYGIYSIILATFLGTMGLPHVLVRFYTNPDGRAARRTALAVLGLLGVFYLVPPVYGALGRLYVPELLLTGGTDAVVLVLPQAVFDGMAGHLLGALVAAGAFAAFLSTSSGLIVSVAGVLSQDVLGGTVRSFRTAAVLAATGPLALAVLAADLPIADAVVLAFAVAASSVCPLLLLGIWWRGLTDVGAALGLLIGGGLAAAAVLVTMLHAPEASWLRAALIRPAAWTVPTAFAVMIVGSLLTRHRRSPYINKIMARMHAPEALGLSKSSARPQ